MSQKPILEVIHMRKQKTPLMLEMPVPEKSFPYLVGNPKNDESNLKWVEQPSARSTVLSWGRECSLEEIISEMRSLIIERGSLEKWDVSHIYINTAEQRMSSLGISEVRQVEDMIVPQDPSLLGCIIVIGTKKYPLIHNPSRGLVVLSKK
tara:strand:- start:1435 stop:1884 length:450 start_codon:yes stop_codon:yes gene_type:complete